MQLTVFFLPFKAFFSGRVIDPTRVLLKIGFLFVGGTIGVPLFLSKSSPPPFTILSVDFLTSSPTAPLELFLSSIKYQSVSSVGSPPHGRPVSRPPKIWISYLNGSHSLLNRLFFFFSCLSLSPRLWGFFFVRTFTDSFPELCIVT